MSVLERDELESERRLGSRIIRAGDVVKIDGLPRGCVVMATPAGPVTRRGFKVLGFRGDAVHVYGAKSPGRAELFRTFPVERVGARPRTSGG